MLNADQIIALFEGLRRGLNNGRYAPHKPLLVLLALARIQRGAARLVPFAEVDKPLQSLLAEFGPTNSFKTRHLPFWFLQSDGDRALWQLVGPASLANRPLSAVPNLSELQQDGVQAGFAPEVDAALRAQPDLLVRVAQRVLDAYFPPTLHADIAAVVGLDLSPPTPEVRDNAAPAYGAGAKRARSSRFREQVLLAYEHRCCVCGFDLRIGNVSAGLEAAHIQWHTAGGPDVEANGLSLCALHHKLFDLGAFTLEPGDLRIVFSRHAIAGSKGLSGELKHHGQPLLRPQSPDLLPGPEFIAWNQHNVFKTPARV
jgi:putative restriction endonuclease